MIRFLLASAALAACAPLALAQPLSGGPSAQVERPAGQGDCRSVLSEETRHGVRIQRGRVEGCDTAQAIAPSPAAAPATRIVVRVENTVEFRARRFGTSPYVTGAPRSGRRDVRYYGTDPSVLGAPGSF